MMRNYFCTAVVDGEDALGRSRPVFANEIPAETFEDALLNLAAILEGRGLQDARITGVVEQPTLAERIAKRRPVLAGGIGE
jgi:hypothetical protein